MKKIIIYFMIITGCAQQQESNIESFGNYFKKVDEFTIEKINDKLLPLTNCIIKLLKNDRLIIFNLIKGDVFVIKLNGEISNHITIKNVNITSDIAVDESNHFYHLNPIKNIIEIYDILGNYLSKFRIYTGQKICVYKGKILIYKTDYKLNFNRLEPAVFIYKNNGEFVKSFGMPPERPNIDKLPIPGGSIFTDGNNIFTSHSSYFKIYVYDNNGNLIKTYDRKPSFYYKLKEFKDLKAPYLTQWYKTTLQMNSFVFNNNTIVSYYMRVDKLKSWLYLQNENNFIEIDIPKHLYFVGTIKDLFIFLDYSKKSNIFRFIKYEHVRGSSYSPVCPKVFPTLKNANSVL